jgi:hypothetical protein
MAVVSIVQVVGHHYSHCAFMGPFWNCHSFQFILPVAKIGRMFILFVGWWNMGGRIGLELLDFSA